MKILKMLNLAFSKNKQNQPKKHNLFMTKLDLAYLEQVINKIYAKSVELENKTSKTHVWIEKIEKTPTTRPKSNIIKAHKTL